MINAMGLPNPGIENEIREIEIAKEEDATVIGSIFGENAKDLFPYYTEVYFNDTQINKNIIDNPPGTTTIYLPFKINLKNKKIKKLF